MQSTGTQTENSANDLQNVVKLPNGNDEKFTASTSEMLICIVTGCENFCTFFY